MTIPPLISEARSNGALHGIQDVHSSTTHCRTAIVMFIDLVSKVVLGHLLHVVLKSGHVCRSLSCPSSTQSCSRALALRSQRCAPIQELLPMQLPCPHAISFSPWMRTLADVYLVQAVHVTPKLWAYCRGCCCTGRQAQGRPCLRVQWRTTRTAPSSACPAVSWCRSTSARARAWSANSSSWPGAQPPLLMILSHPFLTPASAVYPATHVPSNKCA